MQIRALLRRSRTAIFAVFSIAARAGAIVAVPILVAAASSRAEESAARPDVVIRITGHAWYWTYEYPGDGGGFKYKSAIITGEDREPGRPLRLEVDNDMVVPVNRMVKLQVTSDGVIHGWSVPELDLTVDAIPGQISQASFRAEKEGVYRGQCSTLCGEGHAFMPIVVRAVSEPEYEAWLAEMQKKYAAAFVPLPFAVGLAGRFDNAPGYVIGKP